MVLSHCKCGIRGGFPNTLGCDTMGPPITANFNTHNREQHALSRTNFVSGKQLPRLKVFHTGVKKDSATKRALAFSYFRQFRAASTRVIYAYEELHLRDLLVHLLHKLDNEIHQLVFQHLLGVKVCNQERNVITLSKSACCPCPHCQNLYLYWFPS
jgi:hypothetical protein